MNSFNNILDEIGSTPLVDLELGTNAPILGKLEYLNPGGSLKDRSALYMIQEAERNGLLKPGGTIIEASSGNQGIALAMIGAVKGYKVIITVPDKTSSEKVATLRAYGAETIVCESTDSLDDPKGYHATAERLHRELGGFMPNQYFNESNPHAHYHTTGPEIWEQTQGKITHFFAGTGSCGTITGVGRFLKEKNRSIQIIGIDSNHSLYSSKVPLPYDVEGIGIDVISDTLDLSVIDQIVPINDSDAFETTRKLAKRGILVGISSGAVIHVARKIVQNLPSDNLAVAIIGDSGRAYLSKVFGAET
ncbi:MAG: hypothetical protein CR997_05455 [Acidobacteria bacterium]|nr:MAG: hypothetical protein CR997_05455 [Acidobacteriota bacterium]